MERGEDSGTRRLTLRVKQRLVDLEVPCVMGILNATPDSFHAASRVDLDAAMALAERMLEEGAAILDIGGMSTRPGSEAVSEDEELRRVIPVIEAIHQRHPEALLSIDTYRSKVARLAVEAGAGMVNDISAGLLDADMLPSVARLGVPYIAMHMQGDPSSMQTAPHYNDVAAEVTHFLSERLHAARSAGIADVLLDPGFGFGKTTAHNYALLNGLERLGTLGAPLLVGVSRKRMINEVLGTTAATALNGTTVVNTIALLHGAAVLRVHDVREAVEAITVVRAFRENV